MGFYHVFTKDDNLEDIKIESEGFSIWAGILQFFWLFYKGLWVQGFVFLFLNILLVIVAKFFPQFSYIENAVAIALFFYIGANAEDWVEEKNLKQGRKLTSIVYAKNKDKALYHFLRDG